MYIFTRIYIIIEKKKLLISYNCVGSEMKAKQKRRIIYI